MLCQTELMAYKLCLYAATFGVSARKFHDYHTFGVVLSCVLNFFSPESVSIVSCTSRCVIVFFTVVTLKYINYVYIMYRISNTLIRFF